MLLLPETLASTILVKKAARLNKENHDKGRWFVAPSDLCRESLWETCVSGCVAFEKDHAADLELENKLVEAVALALLRDDHLAHLRILGLCLRCVLHVGVAEPDPCRCVLTNVALGWYRSSPLYSAACTASAPEYREFFSQSVSCRIPIPN